MKLEDVESKHEVVLKEKKDIASLLEQKLEEMQKLSTALIGHKKHLATLRHNFWHGTAGSPRLNVYFIYFPRGALS